MEHQHHHSTESHRCCGGGRCGGHCSCSPLSEREKAFIRCLTQIPHLPVTRFLLKSTKSEHLVSVALEPVYLLDTEDSMEHIKESGHVLRSLDEKGLISLDYDLALERHDYKAYFDSGAYRYFLQTVADARTRPDFLYDIGVIECGSMALTQLGYAMADQLRAENESA